MASFDNEPTILADLGLHIPAMPFEAEETTTLEVIGGGHNSDAFLLETGDVIKLTTTSGSHERMERILGIMRSEFDLLGRYYQGHLPETSYYNIPTVRDNNIYRTMTLQNYIEGPKIKDYIKQPGIDREILLSFYRKALTMRNNSGEIPDLACIEEWFKPHLNSNLLITGGEQPLPMLIDTNFGKMQRSRSFGWLWTSAITAGVKNFIVDLELQS
jgi:hypothetical protein